MNELQGISKILVIRFARLGDVTLLLPSLGSLRKSFNSASITLITGSPYAPVGELCPHVDDVMRVDRSRMRDSSKWHALSDIRRLVTEVRSRRFDLVVDFHSFRETNLLAWVSGARYRIGMKRADRAYLPFCFNLPPALEDKSIHVADMFARVVSAIPGADVAPDQDPTIRVPDRLLGEEGFRPSSQPKVAFYVGASVSTRRWPNSRFAAVIRHVTQVWGGEALILSGRSAEEQSNAREIESKVGGIPGTRLLPNPGIPQMAAVIDSADLLVSNDSGPMHIGSALGVPTLGIFSQSLPQHYRPIGPNDRYVRRESVTEVQTDEVLEVLEEMRPTFRGESRDRLPLS